LSNTKRQLLSKLRLVGVGLFFAFVATVFVLSQGNKSNFGASHKTQIQDLANSLCAAAEVNSCNLSWSGKTRWFGALEPETAGMGKLGLDHLRAALPAPFWQQSPQPNGVAFKSNQYEVFYSSLSGAVTITLVTDTQLR
jgi:hypothetical protein